MGKVVSIRKAVWSWIVLAWLSLLDWDGTARLYYAGLLREVNPLANWMIAHWGIQSVLWFKDAALFAWLIAILVSWRRGSLNKLGRLLWLVLGAQAVVTAWVVVCSWGVK